MGAHVHPAYRPDIDGLRAVAVLAVVAFHAFPALLPGGFVGVDVFFVISGFLISGIILDDLRAGRFSLADFYARRVRRIFPALIAVLAATACFGWFVSIGDEFERLGKHLAGAAAFISNFVSLKESGYFDRAAELKPLLHLWSLAVEEQFYLFWPLLAAAMWRRRINFLALVAGVTALSFAASVHWSHANPTLAFYSPLSRFWELMLGCALAYLVRRPGELGGRTRQAVSAAGALLLLGLGLIDRSPAFPRFWALLPTVGALLLIGAGPSAWVNGTVLANPAMAWIGRISYPLYLWHWPLLSMATIVNGTQPAPAVRAALVAAALLLAALTYRYLERPVRAAARPGPAVRIAAASMAAVCALAVLAYAGWWHPRNRYAGLEAAARTGDFEYLKDASRDAPAGAGVYSLPGANPDTTLLIGDSHVAQYAPRLGDALAAGAHSRSLLFVVGGGCLPVPGVREDAPIHRGCPQILSRGLELAAAERVKTVVIGAAWGQYLAAPMGDAAPAAGAYDYYFPKDGRHESFRGGAGVELALQSLQALLERLARTKQVYLLLDNPDGVQFNPYRFLDRRLLPLAGGRIAARVPLDPAQQRVRAMLTQVAERAHVRVIDPMDTLCIADACLRLTSDGEPIYKDDSHLSAAWIEKYAGYLDPAVGG